MFIVLVQVHVKAGMADEFMQESLTNAQASVKEEGILRFDVLRSQADSDRFVLVEVYKDESGPPAHKQTSHYQRWREAVEPMMAEARSSTRYTQLFPADAG